MNNECKASRKRRYKFDKNFGSDRNVTAVFNIVGLVIIGKNIIYRDNIVKKYMDFCSNI